MEQDFIRLRIRNKDYEKIKDAFPPREGEYVWQYFLRLAVAVQGL